MYISIEYIKKSLMTIDKHVINFDINISRLHLYKTIDLIKKAYINIDIYVSIIKDNQPIFYEKYYNVGYKDSFDEMYDYLRLFNQLNK